MMQQYVLGSIDLYPCHSIPTHWLHLQGFPASLHSWSPAFPPLCIWATRALSHSQKWQGKARQHLPCTLNIPRQYLQKHCAMYPPPCRMFRMDPLMGWRMWAVNDTISLCHVPAIRGEPLLRTVKGCSTLAGSLSPKLECTAWTLQ